MKRFIFIFGFKVRQKLFLVRSFFRNQYFRIMGMKIGANTYLPKLIIIWPHQVVIGSNCVVEAQVYFKYDGPYEEGPAIILGDNIFIGTCVEFNIKEKIKIGDYCLIGSGTRFIDHDHGLSRNENIKFQLCPSGEILISDDVWIGANCLILKGVIIGRGAVVAGGSVLTHSIPELEIWGGVPAKKIGTRS